MTDIHSRTAQTVFARVAREHGNLSNLDHRIMRAFEQLLLGQPQITDGRTSVPNICAEAGISRASYYRSPVSAAIKEILSAPETELPETDKLRQEIAELKQQLKILRSTKATELRELRAANAIYANHIQALTLRNQELEARMNDHSSVTSIRSNTSKSRP
ncbi:hypothetical protein [Mycobacteroides abscessus]|uniref:hypothetical protein n=1 Tax=Mycobacteroides abscessus TaxID=36809 RepID=UPI000D9A91AA|nr:hypothetical protein [Mycobacteroides abscessus]SPX82477.1 Uncharacterised protein [Mycobacteroides abscessus]